MMIDTSGKIFVAGHRGLVGSAIVRELEKKGYNNLIVRNREELDLTDQQAVRAFFDKEKPDYVFLAAARVGGIIANATQQFRFITENLQIQTNVIEAAFHSGVKKLVFMGSGCIYPKHAPQPIREDFLLTGPLEPTNEGYAIAKIAGLKMCEFINRDHNLPYISIMPANLYGPGDNFHPEESHVIPGLLRRFHSAKMTDAESVTVWGSGTPRREFLFIDDVAVGTVNLFEKYDQPESVNLGTGVDHTIAELSEMIRDVVGFKGEIRFDRSKPDGTPRKLMDVSKMKNTGWEPETDLREGLKLTYQWCLDHTIFDTEERIYSL